MTTKTKAVSVHPGFQWDSVCSIAIILYYALWIIVCPVFGWSLYRFCTTYVFRLVIVLSLYYLRLSFGHCIVAVLLTAFAWSLTTKTKAVSITETIQ
jgi:hypothetical protein